MEPVIEQAGIEDLTQLLSLHNLVNPDDHWDLERMNLIYDYDLPILTLKVAGEICGVLIYLVCLEEVRLINLTIHPDHQRLGYARKLFYTMLGAARGNGWRYILLDVRTRNINAINFYTGLGCNILCTRRGFYTSKQSAEDAYLMQLDLA